MKPNILLHTYSERTYSADYDDYYGCGHITRASSHSREETWPNWRAFKKALKDKTKIQVRRDSEGVSFAAVCIQDNGVPLVMGNNQTKVLLGRMHNQERAAEISGFSYGLDKLGVRYETPNNRVTLEGGDVVFVGRKLFIGSNGRTNDEGLSWLVDYAERYGYEVIPMKLNTRNSDVRHLTTTCSWAGRNADGEDYVLVNPSWLKDSSSFVERGIKVIEVPTKKRERWAANVLPIGKTLFVQENCPKTIVKLEKAGFQNIETIPWDGMLDGGIGLTCCCFIFNHLKQLKLTH